MQSLPKVVRERLRAAEPSGGHPDANVLTAFAERSLPETERGVVVEHLARCGDCRDVLALASPEPEATQTVFVPARGGWLSWPAFRWAFVTAGVVGIAAIGVVQLQRHHVLTETRQVARLESPASQLNHNAAPSTAEAPVEIRKKAEVATPSPVANSASYVGPQINEQKLIAGAAPAQAPTPSTPFRGIGAGAATGQLQRGSQMPAQWQQQAAGAQAVPLPTLSAPAKQQADMATDRKIPAASEMVQVQAQQVQSEVQTQVQADQGGQLQAQAQPTADQFDYQARRVDKAKPPVSSQGTNFGGPVSADANAQQVIPAPRNDAGLNGRNFAQLTELEPSRMPRWNIGSTGSLQRSLDLGKTWQNVEIRTSIAPENGPTSFVIMPETALAKADNADKKDLKQPAASVIFRAVSAIGLDVWAGGSNGVLYHSVDAGQHWTQVAPSFGRASLTGDIVSVEFSDAQHGKITTSTGEVWVTSDNGQNWQRQ